MKEVPQRGLKKTLKKWTLHNRAGKSFSFQIQKLFDTIWDGRQKLHVYISN